MISKRKRNTIMIYCMASMIILSMFASNVTKITTEFKTNSKKIVAENNYVEVEEISYGLVAIEASSCIEDTEKDQKVTEEKKEENKSEEQKKVTENKKSNTTTKKKTVAKKKTVKTTTVKTAKSTNTSNNQTTNSTNSNKEVVDATANNNAETKTSTEQTTTTNVNNNSNQNTKETTTKDLGTQIADYAKQFVGNPYKKGGTSLTKGADCSGFTMSVYKHFGIKLPRVAKDQAKVGTKVSFSKLKPGDLVFYSNGGSSITHVAIYIGGNKIVHARKPKSGIGITTVNIMTKITARRIV